MKTIFVAGTDTGVGKTVIASGLAAVLRMRGYSVGVMKPVSCGGLEDTQSLIKAAQSTDPIEMINPIVLKSPLSPNVAAEREGMKLDLRVIDKSYAYFKKKNVDYLVVEGCGGLLVPITDAFFAVDLISRLKAKTVLVSRSGLGAINHSLLSLEALQRRRIDLLGVIYNRLSGGPLSVPESTNPEVICRLGRTQALGMFPYMKSCESANCVGKAFLKHIDLKKIIC